MSLVKDLEVSHTGFTMVLNSLTDVLIRRGETDAQRRPGEGERGREDSPLQRFRESLAC